MKTRKKKKWKREAKIQKRKVSFFPLGWFFSFFLFFKKAMGLLGSERFRTPELVALRNGKKGFEVAQDNPLLFTEIHIQSLLL